MALRNIAFLKHPASSNSLISVSDLKAESVKMAWNSSITNVQPSKEPRPIDFNAPITCPNESYVTITFGVLWLL